MVVFNTKQISEGLNLSEETIRRWIRSGELEAESFGKSYRISENNLKEFLVKKGISYEETGLKKIALDLSAVGAQDSLSKDSSRDDSKVRIAAQFGIDQTSNEKMIHLPKLPNTMNTSDNDITKEFFEPCLSWASRYDRGVGYFTSSWLRVNARGITQFAANGGKVRWIISPIMEPEDIEAIKNNEKVQEQAEFFSNLLKDNLELIREFIEKETLNTLSWMVYDGILEFRFAVPINNLEGDFHDKFGIFSDEEGNKISFNGSVNDSYRGTVNYESIKIFTTWNGMNDYVKDDERRFERLWENRDANVAVRRLPEAVKAEIFKLRGEQRPYNLSKSYLKVSSKWRHQNEAIQRFLDAGNGILQMATGTGKTKTAISIINILFQKSKITSVLVTVDGTDLLDQWYKELIKNTNLKVFRYYSNYKELGGYLLNPANSVLLVSRNPEFLNETLTRTKKTIFDQGIIVCDEVHGLGSPALVDRLEEKISKFKFRLGLSATPEREYDEVGNAFITREIGPIIYNFGIEDAIKRGILCEFNYCPLEFELTQEDRNKIQKIISTFSAKKAAKEAVNETDFYTQLAMVRKVSPAKIPVFKDFIRKNPSILERSIIFVETKEFGLDVQNVIIDLKSDFHTYYGEDDRANLVKFSKGEIDCLVTSRRISEGIDIQSVNNIILLSAEKAKLQTIQRIGRCLRTDPKNPEKKACVVDLISVSSDEEKNNPDLNSDIERKEWLLNLAKTKREE